MTRLGLGARICVVLSGAFALAHLLIYKSNLDYWEQYERCEALENTPRLPIGFSLISPGATERGGIGKQRYQVCFQTPPIPSLDQTPADCSVVLPSTGPQEALFIEGPANSPKDEVQTAAYRLGLSGATMKELATPAPKFSSPADAAEYEACVGHYYGKVKKPQLDLSLVVVAFAWIWGLYGVGRFLRGK
jgi:hypothetical protein